MHGNTSGALKSLVYHNSSTQVVLFNGNCSPWDVRELENISPFLRTPSDSRFVRKSEVNRHDFDTGRINVQVFSEPCETGLSCRPASSFPLQIITFFRRTINA
jgi:hypothetical protein